MATENNEAKIIISPSEGKFEISGSEDFVTRQIENFKELIIDSVKQVQPKPISSLDPENQVEQAEGNGGTSSEVETSIQDKYPNVYSFDDDKLKLVCDIPGHNKKEKSINATLLYAYGWNQEGIEEVSNQNIKDICERHGILDKSNFAKYIKSGDPKLYTYKGSGSNTKIRITKPGEKAAKELISQIEQNA